MSELPTTSECQHLASLMQRKFASYLDQKRFEISARSDNVGVYVTVLLRNESGSYYYPVEGRIDFDMQGLSKRASCMLMIDYVDLYFDEYFKNEGQVFLPIDWSNYEHDGYQLHLKGQILNLEIEKLGDQWLEGKVTKTSLEAE